MNLKILACIIVLASCNAAISAMELPLPTDGQSIDFNDSTRTVQVFISNDGTSFIDDQGNPITLNGRKVTETITDLGRMYWFLPTDTEINQENERELTMDQSLALTNPHNPANVIRVLHDKNTNTFKTANGITVQLNGRKIVDCKDNTFYFLPQEMKLHDGHEDITAQYPHLQTSQPQQLPSTNTQDQLPAGITIVQLSKNGSSFVDTAGNRIACNGRKVVMHKEENETFFAFATQEYKVDEKKDTILPIQQALEKARELQQGQTPKPAQPSFNPNDKNIRCKVFLKNGVFYDAAKPTEKVELLGRNIMQHNTDKTRFWFEPENYPNPLKDCTNVTATFKKTEKPNIKPEEQKKTTQQITENHGNPEEPAKPDEQKEPKKANKIMDFAFRYKEAGIAVSGLSLLTALTYNKFKKTIKGKKLSALEFVQAYAKFALKQLDKDPKCTAVALATIVAEAYCLYKRFSTQPVHE